MSETTTNTDKNDENDNNKHEDTPTNGGDTATTNNLTPEALAVIDLMKRQNLGGVDPTTTANTTTNAATAAPGTVVDPTSALTPEQQQLMAAIDPRYKRRLQQQKAGGGDDGTGTKKHAFWDTQPMPRDEIRNATPDGPIVPNKPIEDIRQEPYTMPTGFTWSNVNIRDKDQLTELYSLLTNNYVEDDDALFRFDYSPEFLLWALDPPGSNPNFLFGVRSSSTKKLVAFISGIPATIQIYDKTIPVVEINYLCVHKKLREKRLAPVLIKEITRRVNLTGVFQAVYTAGQLLPVPVGSARYHHRSLNPKKLIKIGFSRLPGNSHRMTMARMQKLYKLPDDPITPGLRPMTQADVPGVHALLTKYLVKFSLRVLFTHEDIAHWLLPRDKVINSYVITNEDGKEVTDFISFYHLPSSVLHHDDKLYAAYSYYNVATTVPLQQLMKDALILAKNTGCDVFNALDLMENKTFLETLKFGIGDGILQYYVYNWSCPEMPPNQVGIVLL